MATNQFSAKQSTGKYPTQEELTQFLVGKLRNFNNVVVNTIPMNNDRGTYYRINVKNKMLSKIGNSIFHSVDLNTVSHTSRVINIKLLFQDNEERNKDMLINADAILQIFRNVCNQNKENGDVNKTIENVALEEIEDKNHYKHLALVAQSTKGASLVYIYLRVIEFVREVGEKYGSADDIEIEGLKLNEPMSIDKIEAEKQLLQKKLRALEEMRQAQLNGSASDNGNDANEIEARPDSTPTPDSRSSTPRKFNIVVGGKLKGKIRTPTPTQTTADTNATADE